MNRVSRKDLHILKYCSSFVSISCGKVFYVSDPKADFCPLARRFYKDIIGKNNDKKSIKEAIRRIIEFKIEKFGFFTEQRNFDIQRTQVPYGASEMLMRALQSKVIDAAVVVCDGAGTVISSSPQVVQGIGGRMHNIIMTSPIARIISKLSLLGCIVLSGDAIIDQTEGVRKAIDLGYKAIGVTMDGHSAKHLERLKGMGKKYGVKIISLITCTTGVNKEEAEKIRRYGDLAWSCLSEEIRRAIGPAAKMQLSSLMPVYAISEEGVRFASL